jgi:hypothetical protein
LKQTKPGTKLGEQYYDADRPVGRERLLQAGIRVAMTFNKAFRESDMAARQ